MLQAHRDQARVVLGDGEDVAGGDVRRLAHREVDVHQRAVAHPALRGPVQERPALLVETGVDPGARRRMAGQHHARNPLGVPCPVGVEPDHLDAIGHFYLPTHVPPHFDWLNSGQRFTLAEFHAIWRDVAYFLFR